MAEPAQTTVGPDIVPAVTIAPILIIKVVAADPHELIVEYLIVSNPIATGVRRPATEIVALLFVMLHVPPKMASV
jgi:hypothetical protein